MPVTIGRENVPYPVPPSLRFAFEQMEERKFPQLDT